MCGALIAERVSLRFGMRRTLFYSYLVFAAASTLIPLASGPVWRGAAFLMVSQLIGDCAIVIHTTSEISVRQTVTPDDRLGRVNAAMHFLGRGVLPVGALAGGVIAQITGLRGAIAIAVAGIWLSSL